MDEFRYALGLILIILMPIVIIFWVVIHSGSSFWRRQPVSLAYSTAGFVIVIVAILAFSNRQFLLWSDLGTNYILFILGSIIYLASWFLWRPVKRHLDFKTFAGIPEVKDEKIDLIQDGPFAIVRHPRYFMVAIGVLGWCLMSHYAGVYIVGLASILGLVLIMTLEERDLVARFGDEYNQYKKQVPQFIPTLEGAKQFLKENF